MDENRKDTKRLTLSRRFKCYRLRLARKLHRFAPHHSLHWLATVLIIIPVGLLDGCVAQNKTASNPLPAPVPVAGATAVRKNVPIYISALGSVTPINTVTVKTQVDGQLMHIYFADGQMVQAGELLAQIDSRPYEALMMQYQGQLVRDTALLANARIDLDRYTKLFAQDSISQQTLETQKYLVKQYEGAIKADQGQLDSVQVSLNYCKITAPVSGRLGLLEVDPGNIVQTTDTTGIVVINTMSPIYVDFAIPEDSLPHVAEKIAAGNRLITVAQDRAQNKTLATGILLTTNNQIDTATGTVTLRALFDNKDHILFPNQFVNVQLLIDVADNAVVVPTAAVQYGNDGTYVYVMHQDQTVSIKPVKIITSLDDSTAIISEVTPGDIVITEGTDKLKEGAIVSIATTEPKQGSNNNGSV